MEPGPARSGAGGNRRGGAFAVPAARSRERAVKFVLAAAAGLALASGVMTGMPAAHAAAAVPARAAAAVHAYPRFDPCPCVLPICRPGCLQSAASGSPASMIYRQPHLAAAAAVSARAVAVVHAYPMFVPCPCDKPICRPGCSQSAASGGPASMIHRQPHLAAAAAVSARPAAAVHAQPIFEPCPCAEPVCRPLCFQSAVSNGPASMIHRQPHLAAAAVSARTGAAVHASPRFEPCPCDHPVCRPACFQSVAVGGPASGIHRQPHLAAAATVSARTGAAAHAQPRFEPCPCDHPVCRPVCFQSVAVGGPAAGIHRQTHLAAAQAVDTSAAAAVNCPPPTAPATTSQDGNPSC